MFAGMPIAVKEKAKDFSLLAFSFFSNIYMLDIITMANPNLTLYNTRRSSSIAIRGNVDIQYQ